MKTLSADTIKALGVWVVSLLVGLLATWFIIFIWLDTNLDLYGAVYALLTVVSIGSVVLIWLDYLADTKILPD